jgi:hypothetical protein
MSLEQLEEQIRQLPAGDLARLTGWFDRFLGRSAPDDTDDVVDLTGEEKAELLRRRDELRADPASAQLADDEYFAGLKRDLANARTRPTSGS